MKRSLNLLLCSLVFVVLEAPLLMGQTAGGTIVGTVQDPTGALVPGAEVAVSNTQTGTMLKTNTSSAGQYVFPVVPGTYTITITAKGFQQAVISQVIVPLNKTLTEDATLQLGATTAKVEVSASVVQLEVHTSQAATAIDQTTYASLPIALNGAARSPTMRVSRIPLEV